VTWSPNKLWRSTSIFNLCMGLEGFSYVPNSRTWCSVARYSPVSTIMMKIKVVCTVHVQVGLGKIGILN
jgi:hypothetical protein